MRTIRKAAITWVFLTLGFLPVVEAAQPASNTWVLTIYHQRGEYELRSEGADERKFVRGLGEQIPIELNTDEKVIVKIADPNPFLYSYSWNRGAATPTANFEAISKLSDALGGFIKALGSFNKALETRDKLASLVDRSDDEASLLQRFTANLAEAIGEPAPDSFSARGRTAKVAALLFEETSREDLEKLQGDLELLATCVKALPNLVLSLDRGSETTASLRTSLEVAQVKRKSTSEQLDKLEESIDADLATWIVSGTEPRGILLNDLFVRRHRPAVEKAFEQLEAFGKSLDQADKLAVGKLDEVSYDGERALPAKLTITVVDEPPGGIRPTRSTNELNFVFKPYSSFVLGIGAAAMYSFVERPKFEATAKDDAFEIVEKKSDDYVGFNLAALLTITPRRWYKSDFHPLFEIGVKPDTDDLGLYAGVAVAYGKNFGMGVGVAFEQVDELADGLEVGQILTAADELKFDKKFRSGVYLHLTAKFDIGAGAN